MASLTVESTINGSGTQGPTGALFENIGEIKKYQYPSNLSSLKSQHFIVFTFMKVTPDFKPNIGTQVTTNYNEIERQNPSGTIPKIDKDKDPVQQAEDIAAAVGRKALNIGTALVQSVATSGPSRTVDKTVGLYIPDTVNVSYSAQYEEIGLSKALGTPYFLAQAGASAYQAYKNMQEGNLTNIVNAVGNDPYAREAIGRFLGGIKGLGIDGEAVSKLLNRSAGEAFNPQLQVLFQGIDFRRFQFDFTMTPSNLNEAKQIENIIYAFKYASAPEIQIGQLGNGMFFKIPDTVNVEFYQSDDQGGTKQNSNVHRIGECVIENVTVDYAPMGWSTYKDGYPVQTKLSIQLKEIGIIDKTQIKKGY
jgi:hypothetical protein